MCGYECGGSKGWYKCSCVLRELDEWIRIRVSKEIQKDEIYNEENVFQKKYYYYYVILSNLQRWLIVSLFEVVSDGEECIQLWRGN